MIIPPGIGVENLSELRDALHNGDFSKAETYLSVIVKLKGGAGSGFHGHKGRPGLEGGSLPRNVSSLGYEGHIKTEDSVKTNEFEQFFVTVKDKVIDVSAEDNDHVGYVLTALRSDPDNFAEHFGSDVADVTYRNMSYQPVTDAMHNGVIRGIWYGNRKSPNRELDLNFYEFTPAVLSRLRKLVEDGVLPTADKYVLDSVVNLPTPDGSKASFVELTHDQFMYGKKLVRDLDSASEDFPGYWILKDNDIVEKQLPIKEKDRQKFLQLRINIFYDTTDKLSEQVYSGEITIGQWEEQMRAELRQLHSSAAAIAKGGWDEMTSADWGRLGTPLREQYKYLHGFATTIDEQRDTISLKAIQARARMYGRATKATAALVQAGPIIENLLPWIPGTGTTRCLTNCKCVWVLKVIKIDKISGDKTVSAVWRLTPAEHCEDCLDRNGHTETFVVPKDVKVPKYIGRLS